MFPERLVVALLAFAAGSGLLVLERNAVAALGDQAGRAVWKKLTTIPIRAREPRWQPRRSLETRPPPVPVAYNKFEGFFNREDGRDVEEQV
jgi:hypothetical protein